MTLRTRPLAFTAIAMMVIVGPPPFDRSPAAQTTSWFRSGFDTPGPLNRYEFAYFAGEADAGGNGTGRAGLWSFEHLPNGDYDGSGAAHLWVRGGLAYPADQFTWGWNVGQAALNRSFALGDAMYFRWRISFDSGYRWNGVSGNAQNKFISVGNTCAEPCLNSRALIMIMGDAGNNQCTLGANPANPGVGTQPPDFGLPGFARWTDPAIDGRYGGFSIHKNIGNDCAGPAAVTYSGNPQVPTPGPGSVAPTQPVWYHCQAFIKSGANNDAQFKLWCNNNNFASPTQQKIGGFTLGVDGWGSSATPGIGGHMTDLPLQTNGYRVGAFEIGASFDPNWFPGTSATVPSAPQNLRIVRPGQN